MIKKVPICLWLSWNKISVGIIFHQRFPDISGHRQSGSCCRLVYRGVQKSKKLEFEWADCFFPLHCVSGLTKKNSSVLAIIFHPPLATYIIQRKFKKYKGKYEKSVFWNFEPLNFYTSCFMTLVCIPEVLMHLLTPILPYLDISNIRSQMRHLCQKCQKGHIWHICPPTHVIYRYGNMGVKRCVRTSGI